MRAADLELLTTPGTVDTFGDLVLVSLATPDFTTNSYRGGLHRVGPDGEVTRWTYGDRDFAQRISPDGTQVAFLRVSGKGKPQLWVMPVAGGEARQVTELPLGAGAPVWAPDSRRLAFVARVAESGRYGTADKGSEAEAPRRITRLDYRLDDIGFLGDRRARLFVLDLLDGVPVEVTDGSFDVADPCWTSSGTEIIVVTDRDLGVVETLHNSLYAIPATGGEPRLVVAGAGEVIHPVVDGEDVYFVGSEVTGTDFVARNLGLWRVAGGAAVRLTDAETVDVEKASGHPVVTPTGVLVPVRNRGAIELCRVPLDARAAELSSLEILAGQEGAVRSFTSSVAVVSTQDSPGVVQFLGGATVPFSSVPALPLRELVGTASDGYPVHGWLVLPEGDGPHPVVLAVHGGPYMYHGPNFFDEAQVYAEAGYAVVLPNPRGSAGYGQAHGRSVVGRFGTVDVDDVLSVLDLALAQPECDAERVGVMGGSYGGFMTSWLAAHHGERFRAAWSERAVNAWDSFAGSSDIGWFFTDAYCGPDPEVQRALSPLTYVEKINIPFLVVHSENDWRCPVEQAQRLFVALRRNGVDAEMLLFPGEGHELTRSGQPVHRKQRFDAVLEWWGRHLMA